MAEALEAILVTTPRGIKYGPLLANTWETPECVPRPHPVRLSGPSQAAQALVCVEGPVHLRSCCLPCREVRWRREELPAAGERGGHEEGQPARLESEMLSLGAAVSSEESATRHVVCAVWVRLPL